MSTQITRKDTMKGLAGCVAAIALLLPPLARASEGQAPANPAPAAQAPAPPRASGPTSRRPVTLTKKAKEHFQAAWGVDRLKVSRVASGNLIRFTYRVTDPAQAAQLVDRNVNPVLYARRAHAMLSVPVMEKIGALRQSGALKAGQEYWVAFSNKGNLVKPGDLVDVIVGQFHAPGLMVQ
jgi:hypothetical protein